MATTKCLLQQALEACDYECRAYSGYGMYGKYCLGVEIEDISNLATLGYDVRDWLQTEGGVDTAGVWHDLALLRFAEGVGRRHMAYFPHLTYREDDVVEENENE